MCIWYLKQLRRINFGTQVTYLVTALYVIYIGICQQTLDTKVCNACIHVSANQRCPIWNQHGTYKLAYNDMNR